MLNITSDSSNIRVILSLVLLIAMSLDNDYIFSPCFFVCLIIIYYMVDIMCKPVEIQVNNI